MLYGPEAIVYGTYFLSLHRPSSGRQPSGGLLVFVWLSDNRRLAVFVLLVVVFLFVIIAIVWVSRRHIADEIRPSETVFGEELDHVGIPRADPRRFRETSRLRFLDYLVGE